MNNASVSKSLAILLLLLVSMTQAKALASPSLKTIGFHGIRATDPDGRMGLRNPERGLRYESHIGNAIGEENNHMDWIRAMQGFAADGMTLSQTYCYLDANLRTWQPFHPQDPDYKPLLHTISYDGKLPENIKPGKYTLGLWLPDPKPTIRLDPKFAVRVANRDSKWWISVDGQYGVNTLHQMRVTE